MRSDTRDMGEIAIAPDLSFNIFSGHAHSQVFNGYTSFILTAS